MFVNLLAVFLLGFSINSYNTGGVASLHEAVHDIKASVEDPKKYDSGSLKNILGNFGND